MDLVPGSVPGAGSCSLPLPAASRLDFGPFPEPPGSFSAFGAKNLLRWGTPSFFPKSAFLSAWIFRDSPEPPQLLSSLFSPFFGGKSWIFLSPLALYGAGRSRFPRAAPELPESGIFIFFPPPFYFQPCPTRELLPAPLPLPRRFPGFWWIWEIPCWRYRAHSGYFWLKKKNKKTEN